MSTLVGIFVFIYFYFIIFGFMFYFIYKFTILQKTFIIKRLKRQLVRIMIERIVIIITNITVIGYS